MKKLIVGNWKMNGSKSMAKLLASAVVKRCGETENILVMCPPAPYLGLVSDVIGAAKTVFMGAQDCHFKESGAHTGDVSAQMLSDMGCKFVILGHSERRQNHGEGSYIVSKKAEMAAQAKLTPIICVGETLDERNNGEHAAVVIDQLKLSIPDAMTGDSLIIAYEPVWAIGTGQVASGENIQEMHALIRAYLNERFGQGGGKVPILYGGSVKPDNARAIFEIEHVNGALIGGASLKEDDFLEIAKAG